MATELAVAPNASLLAIMQDHGPFTKIGPFLGG